MDGDLKSRYCKRISCNSSNKNNASLGAHVHGSKQKALLGPDKVMLVASTK